MNLQMDTSVAEGYKSESQRIRRITENWMAENMFCPRCGHLRIEGFRNNRPVADGYCPQCNSQYELKSKRGKLPGKVTDGAYRTMIERITSDTNPDFFFLLYIPKVYIVNTLIIVPKYFFTPGIIEARPPLSPSAMRKDWVGCNILLSEVPAQGQITIVNNGIPRERYQVVEELNRSCSLSTKDINARGWLMDILKCVNTLGSEYFTLDQMYSFVEALSSRHPDNNNVQAKIRQQLQLLRDKGYIEFLGNGKYKKIL